MTTMPKMTELAVQWHHEWYQPPTLKYPAWYYFLKKIVRFWELLEFIIHGTVPVFAYKEWENPWKTLGKAAGVPAKTQTEQYFWYKLHALLQNIFWFPLTTSSWYNIHNYTCVPLTLITIYQNSEIHGARCMHITHNPYSISLINGGNLSRNFHITI
jgi:hypothetical protein